MRRIIVLTAVAALLIAACGGGDDTGSDTTTTSTIEATTTTQATTTTEPTTTTEGGDIVPGEDPDVDAIVAAYQVVFDSSTSYEEKARYLTEPDGLEETVAKYAETGESFGGVTLEPTSVVVSGDEAAVVYDFLFGGVPSYQGLEGDAVRADGDWKVTREMFCAIMGSARVGCPES